MRWWSSSQLPDGGLRLLGTPFLFSTTPHHLARDCSDFEIFLAPKLSTFWWPVHQPGGDEWPKIWRKQQLSFCRSKELDLGVWDGQKNLSNRREAKASVDPFDLGGSNPMAAQ